MIDIKHVAVVSAKQTMEPAFPEEPLKPPSYPNKDNVAQYLIYQNGDLKDVVLDTHQSQANRIEPAYDNTGLIPDSTVKAGEKFITVTRLGHRLADAAIYFSNLRDKVQDVLKAFMSGNAMPVAKLSPTALIFGLWDSRPERSRAKITRIFNAEIRAHNVIEVPAAGQYISSVPRLDDQVNKDLSAVGLLDCPYGVDRETGDFINKGGVLVKGEITRNVRLNLRGIRRLCGVNTEETERLQNYVLGLGLFALTYAASGDLREGCNLVTTSSRYSTFAEDGTRSDISLKHEDVLVFAKKAAKEFGVGEAIEFVYDPSAADASASGKADAKEEKTKAKKSGKVKTEAAGELVQV